MGSESLPARMRQARREAATAMASLPAAGLSLKEAGPLRPEVGERRDKRLDGAGATDGAAATNEGAEPPSATPGRPEHGRRDARETPAPAPESLPLQQE